MFTTDNLKITSMKLFDYCRFYIHFQYNNEDYAIFSGEDDDCENFTLLYKGKDYNSQKSIKCILCFLDETFFIRYINNRKVLKGIDKDYFVARVNEAFYEWG